MPKPNSISLQDLFLSLQKQMKAEMATNSQTLKHPVAKGDATEAAWIKLFNTYLPRRYQAERAFVIDHDGRLSEQVDVVIFDRHFSPFIFKQGGQSYVPSESVYAAFEVKPKLSKANIEYASKKVRSVRELKRTSATIIDKGKACKPRQLTRILGGLLTTDGSLTPKLAQLLRRSSDEEFLDLGCSIGGTSFLVSHDEKRMAKTSDPKESLVFFFLNLLRGLQSVGTVAPMDIEQYARNLTFISLND